MGRKKEGELMNPVRIVGMFAVGTGVSWLVLTGLNKTGLGTLGKAMVYSGVVTALATVAGQLKPNREGLVKMRQAAHRVRTQMTGNQPSSTGRFVGRKSTGSRASG